MHSFFDHHWRVGEKRLCAHALASGPSATPPSSFENFGMWTAEVTKWMYLTVMAPPVNFVKGIAKSAWDAFPSKEKVADFLRDTLDFFASIPPSIQALIERAVAKSPVSSKE